MSENDLKYESDEERMENEEEDHMSEDDGEVLTLDKIVQAEETIRSGIPTVRIEVSDV